MPALVLALIGAAAAPAAGAAGVAGATVRATSASVAPGVAPPRSAPAGASASAAKPRIVAEVPCPGSSFTCITLQVPRDHFGPPGGPTFDVTFGLLRATSDRPKGVFVTVTGGPGTSGLASADSYTAAFDPQIPRDYDLVFFDQRGVGLSQPLQCPKAALAFYSADAVPTLGPAQAQRYALAARRFSSDCVAETRVDPSDLPFYATSQSVEDLDAFRTWLGVDKIDLYGESYGTQYAQTYAAAHPDHVRSLFLDGPVDLTLTGTQYYAEDVRAFDTVLTMTLTTCTIDSTCRSDVAGVSALSAYDRLAARLRHGSIPYSFVTRSGKVQHRRLGLGDLETAAAGYVYSTYDRMLLQRAIAQATHGQLAPLARLAYLSLGENADTLAPVPDPTYSDAMYYAVECMDYDYVTGTPDESAQAYLAAGVAAGVARVRLGSVFYGDLPCAYWPAHPATDQRPAPLTDTPFPVFVLASSTDPATPYAGALRIYQRLSNGYLIVTPGGPHIIFGRGNECPDLLVTKFLVSGFVPGARQVTCDPAGVDPYVPNPAQTVRGYGDALDAMIATDDEIVSNADYWNWDGTGTLQFGCLRGGWIRYVADADGAHVALHGCAFTAGLPLTGHATIDTTDGTFALSATGPRGTRLRYLRDADGFLSVTGRFFGRRVNLQG